MPAEAPIRWFPRRSTASAALPPFDPAEFSPRLHTRMLILQPTPFCNIRCDYCYLPDRQNKARMQMGTVRAAARHLRSDGLLGDELTVVWHAGEPLTLPPAFYEEAIAAIREEAGPACVVSHSIQTNGTLIDDAWCDFFVRHRIRLGLSVDGPASLHDAHRRTRNGHGTHARVQRAMELLKARGISYHVIAVVTADTFGQADAFYGFFAAHGVAELGCNFDEVEGPHAHSTLQGREDAHEAFLQQLLEHARRTRGGPRIRELELAGRLIAHGVPGVRWRGHRWPDNAQSLPFAMISVSHRGDFSTFSPELLGQQSIAYGDFVLGNVARSGYLAASHGQTFQRIWADVLRGVQACEHSCEVFAFCGGGAPGNKLYENGDLASGETLYCRTMVKRPFDVVLRDVECLVAAVEPKHPMELS